MIALLVVACAPTNGVPAAGDSVASEEVPTWYGDVEPIVVENCGGCHSEGALGPFPLTTYAAAKEMAPLMADAVASRTMPPWEASPECGSFRGDMSLSDADIARIVAWSEAGAPEGDSSLSKGVIPEGGTLTRTDFNIPMPEAYTPGTGPDDYRCFLLDWPEAEPTYLTGYRVNPDRDGLVHHVVMYLATPDQVEAYRTADAAEDGEGFTCFGGPGVVSQADAVWLGGWAPGAQNGDFPNGTGISIDPGSLVVMQVHYNTEHAESGPDQTTIDFMVDSSVSSPAIIQPWTDPAWLESDLMMIPAGQSGVTHRFSYDLSGYAFRIHTANLHMHTHGVSGRLWLTHGDGSEECLLEIPKWDFNWQRTFVLDEPVTVNGDTLSIQCTWDNPTDHDIVWGEGTGDEMCLGTMLWSF